MSVTTELSEDKKHKITTDDMNPRIYLHEIKCDGCHEWYNEEEGKQHGEKFFCEDCEAHWECPNCGNVEHTWRNSCGELQCDNCGYAEEDE